MKHCIFIICFSIACVNFSFAQESGKLRTGFEAGCLYPIEDGFGFWGAFELKYNLQYNMNVGFRTEYAGFWKNESDGADLLSFSVTYDYYFHSNNKLFTPFAGAGLGYYFCKPTDFSGGIEYSKYNNPTCFLRIGFELGKFRTALAYNLIRKHSELYPINRNCDYIALNIGFYIGGGK